MPLARIDLQQGKSPEYRTRVGDAVYQAMRATINVPEHDRFLIITEHPPGALYFDREYLGINRSDDCIFIQVTLAAGRTTEAKQAFYKAIADGLHQSVGLRREDVFIQLVEVQREDWSFGNGEAQYVTAK
jgi:4-oxalocrotonate tautomerase